MSVIKDFTKLKKYNIQSLADPEPQKTDNAATSTHAPAAGTNTAVKSEASDLPVSQNVKSSAVSTSLQSEETPEVGGGHTEEQENS